MGCSEYAPGKLVFVTFQMPAAHALPEAAQRLQHRLKPVQHIFRELSVMVGIFLDLVKNRRFDVCDDETIEVVEKSALNDVTGQGNAFLAV